MRMPMRVVVVVALLLAACDDQGPDAPRYYERVIQPILTTSCVRNQGGCHRDDGSGNALGNLDLTSYAAVTRRRDVLRRFGPYPVPLLLLKASGAAVPPIPFLDGEGQTQLVPSGIQHAGGATLSVQSSAYFELQRWLENGATEDGSPAVRPRQSGSGDCRRDFATVRPDVAMRLASVDATDPAFRDFAANVEPILTSSCAIGTCHSAEQSDFFLTCRGSGSDDASKFNFLEARAYVLASADTSPLVLKPLAPSAGGLSHTGGVFFTSRDDNDWKHLAAWATEVGADDASAQRSDGERFFDDEVMPVLLARGCALEACHSPGAANDFKLRAGAPGGFLSAYARAFNYQEARRNFLVADVPDVRQSRLVKKPIVSVLEGGLGLPHRGGPPLQSAGEAIDPAACPRPWTSDATPFCTVVEWHRRERAALVAAGSADEMAAGSTLPLVAITRPPDGDRLIDFDTYRPGADLVLGRVTVGALGSIDPASAAVSGSLLDHCAGVHANRDNVDARRPAVSYDATKVAVALRLGASDTLDLYEITLDAAHACRKITDGNGRAENGILVHNLDPMYAPDGTLVFASTRGRTGVGPTRSLKYLLPQTDLLRMAPDASSPTGYGAPEAMTALLGDELAPAMMLNGQISFTAEKASADFYQLSGRRINWDLTDYHPLLAQRAQSPGLDGTVHPSVGYQQATEIREGVDRDFMLILSDAGARGGGGALGRFSRSVGPFEADRSDVTFLRALTIIDGDATGRAGPTRGAYRAPCPLPDGRVLVSYAPDVRDLSADTPRYDLVVVDSTSGARTPLAGFGGGGASHLEAQLVYKREPRPLYRNVTQLVFGGSVDGSDSSRAIVHYPDLPMLATLLGANLRTGRFIDRMRGAAQVVLYEDQAPPADLAAAMAARTGSENVAQSRRRLGAADLEADGSVQLRLPPLTPLVLELVDGDGQALFTMSEEDQLGPGEHISRGVPRRFFNSTCGGCHGSISGRELDIALDPDALTGASVSQARTTGAVQAIGP
jgi:hypothetical protein